MITAIVMASGEGKRFDGNKLLYKIKNKPLYSYTLENLKSSKIDDIIVVSQYKKISDYCNLKKIKCINNKNSHIGQSESIKIGIHHASASSDYMFFVADQPLLNYSTINILIDEFVKNKEKIVIPTYNNIYFNPKIFPNWTKTQLLKLFGDNGGRSIIKNNKNSIHLVPFKEKSPFIDIDSKEDLNLIRKYL